jgi:1,2-dihydroxy-3-keto-5-methylthiopentene dioxygenase
MATITFHDREGQPLRPPLSGSAADAALWQLGACSGRWALRSQAVSGTPQLTYARELHALSQRFHSVMTDRVRQRTGAHRADPRDHHGVAWPEQRHQHVHADSEVRVLLQGSARYLLRSPRVGAWVSVICEAGDWLALPPGLPHSFEASTCFGVELLRLFAKPGGWLTERTASQAPAALLRWDEPSTAPALAWAA